MMKVKILNMETLAKSRNKFVRAHFSATVTFPDGKWATFHGLRLMQKTDKTFWVAEASRPGRDLHEWFPHYTLSSMLMEEIYESAMSEYTGRGGRNR